MPDPVLDPLPLPGPAWLLWSLLTLTYFLHLLPMNFVLGGSLIAAVARLRGGSPARPHHRALAAWLARAMPVSVAAAVIFGMAPLLFVQALYGRPFFTGTGIMSWFWFGVIPLLILASFGHYLLASRGERLGGVATAVAWLTAILFLAIGFLYSNNMAQMLRPDLPTLKVLEGGAGLPVNPGDPSLWPRFLHIVLGAVAVAGMGVAHFGLYRVRREPEFGDWAVRYGTLWFLVPTLLNFLVGSWWLVALPRDVMLDFMGRDGTASAVLVLGVLLSLATVLLMSFWIHSSRPALLGRIAGVCLLLTLLAMIFTRDHVRQGALQQAGFQVDAGVEPRWGPLVLFALMVLAALGAVAWMVRTLIRPRLSSEGG